MNKSIVVRAIAVYVVILLVVFILVLIITTFLTPPARADTPTANQLWRYCGEADWHNDGVKDEYVVGTYYAGGCVETAVEIDLGTPAFEAPRVFLVSDTDFRQTIRYYCDGGSCFGLPPRFLSVGVETPGGVAWSDYFDAWGTTWWTRIGGRYYARVGLDWGKLVRAWVKSGDRSGMKVIVRERPVWGHNLRPWHVVVDHAARGVLDGER